MDRELVYVMLDNECDFQSVRKPKQPNSAAGYLAYLENAVIKARREIADADSAAVEEEALAGLLKAAAIATKGLEKFGRYNRGDRAR